jgi:phosphate uptake regulator
VTDKLRDTLYTVVGFGVLGVQQAQVRRRDLQKSLARLVAEVDERVDPVLEDLQTRLPEEARPLVDGARSAARSFERVLLGRRPAG